jgi:CMP-N-acetylneuraminic acid synthetase
MARFESQKFNSMLSAVRVKRFFWNDNGTPVNYDPLSRPRRQDFSGTLMENGAFYITRRDALDEYQCRLGGRIGVYEMANETALEIDEPEDWDQVEKLLFKIRG